MRKKCCWAASIMNPEGQTRWTGPALSGMVQIFMFVINGYPPSPISIGLYHLGSFIINILFMNYFRCNSSTLGADATLDAKPA